MTEPTSTMNVDSFEELVAPHMRHLYGFACRRMRSSADAEDLVQDTLLRAWGRLDSLRDPERIRPWLFTIMVNLHAEQARKHTRRQRLMPIKDLESSLDEHLPASCASPLDEVIRSSAAEAVHEALAKVPAVYAVAVELRDLEGFAYKEIAEILDIPLGTAMSRIGRGRKMMAKLLSTWRPVEVAAPKLLRAA